MGKRKQKEIEDNSDYDGDKDVPEWCENYRTGCRFGKFCIAGDKECGHDKRFEAKRLAKTMGITEAQAREHIRSVRAAVARGGK